MISDAKFGPDRATKLSSKYSSIKFPIVFKEGYSIPLAVVTSIVSSAMIFFKFSSVILNAEDGIDKKIISHSFKSSKSLVATILSFNWVLG